ncbi:S8 family serine peptidase [Virgibacillus sp. DJP39]|uniref:S8 family serine peptidase n=1 Tax=Virgibacillus sp. DJP39 TaxID=3409790 RepID=UPI003BB74A59
MINHNTIKKGLIILVIFLFVLPQLSIASGHQLYESTVQTKLNEIDAQDKEKLDEPVYAERKKRLIEELPLMQDRYFGENLIISQSSQLSVNPDAYFEEFRKSYTKNDTDFRIQSEKSIDLSNVNNRGILLKVKEGVTFNPEVFDVRIQSVSEQLKSNNIYLVTVPEQYGYSSTLNQLKEDSSIVYANPDYIIESSYIPSDPQFAEQWYLDKIDMPEAWDINKGSSDITIAVLDSGVNANHPDLQGRVLAGYDFVNDDTDASDDNSHGTHVSGIIASNSNSIGISGVDLNATILPVKIANENGLSSVADSIQGIYYAIEQGVDVINMSYGSYQYNSIVEDAIWDAYKQGIVLVAAAGNDAISTNMYPASYEGVISVAATDKYDQRAGFSNYGGFVDITAPGKDIYSTYFLGGYGSSSGTSFSAPIVSALAGMVKAQHPEWSPAEIEWALQNGADNFGSAKWNMYSGYGRVNALGALTTDLPLLQNDASDVKSGAETLINDQLVNGKVDLPMDVDWYSFEVLQSADVRIDLSNIPNHLDLVGGLFKYNGNTVVDQKVIDEGGLGESEQLQFETEPGTYYLAVYDYYDHWSDQSHSLEVSIETNSMDDSNIVEEKEPNDSMDTATILPFEAIGGGHFQTYEDYDLFEVKLPYSGDIIVTTATNSDAYYSDPVAILLDANGNVINEAELTWDSDWELKYSFEKFVNIKAGKYYALITNLQGYSDYNPYVFDISYIGDVVGEIPVPLSSIDSGTYTGSIDVELSSQSGTLIRYTLDGTNPDLTNGVNYTGPITIDSDSTLKVIAVQDGFTSKVITYDYLIEKLVVAAPEASVPSGEFTEQFQLNVTSDLLDAKIFYTLDGSTPSLENGFLYDEPIVISNTTVLKAIAVHGNIKSDVSTFTYTNTSNIGKPFSDTVDHWAENDISFLAEKQIINGYPDNSFHPNESIKRSESASMIVKEMDLPLEGSDFPDVSESHWASGYIGAASKAGIITGYNDGDFIPNAYLSREEMAVILVRAYKLSGSSSMTFSDLNSESWSYSYVEKLVANEITTGYSDGTFRPKNDITRAEFCAMLARVLE